MDDLFGKKIVRFDDEDENRRRQDEASASAGRPRSSQPLPFDTPPLVGRRAGSALRPVIAPQQDRRTDWQAAPPSAAPGDGDDPDGKWHRGLPDDIRRMYAIAMQEKAYTLEEMHRVAQALCHDEWDGQSRAGKHPELWLPSQTADLIIRSVENRLRSARVSQDPDLVENYQRVAAELSQAKAEMDGLRQRLHSAETTVREMKADALKEAMRKQKYAEEKAQTGYVKQRVSSPPPAPRVPVAAPRAAVVDAPPVVVGTDADAESEEIGPLDSGNERRDDVVRVLAESGLCRAKDVRAALAKKWSLPNDSTTHRPIKLGIKAGLIDIKRATLEWGGQPYGNIFMLTAKGRELAKSLGVQPVKSQYDRGMALHKNESHLYLILEVAEILRDNGYGDVDPFPPSMTLPGGNQQYQPDIKARMPSSDNATISIEVERDTYKATDRDNRSSKWLRAAAAGRGAIYLITPNNEALTTILAEIDDVRKQNPGQKIRVMAVSIFDFRKQKDRSGAGIVWVERIGAGAV